VVGPAHPTGHSLTSTGPATVGYVLFLLANAALFVRPAELLPALGDLQIYLALIAAAMLCNLYGLQNQMRPRTLIQQPINLCVLGVVAAVPVSHLLSTLYLGGAYHGFVTMAKIAVYYLLLVATINTPTRLRQLMLVTAVCGTIVVGASILDFANFKARWEGTDEVYVQLELDKQLPPDEQVLKHVVETHGTDLLGNETLVFRMRGLGIFNDPNDVSLLIAVAAIICVYFLSDRSLSVVRFLWIGPLVVLGYGFLQTQSRGGLLAFGAGGMVWLAVKYGGKVAITLGVLGMLAAPIALGRAGNMDVSDGSGQDRIQIWGEGLAEIKSPKILFGIGEGQYEEAVGHVAHNSYIHAFVELGFLGGTIFFGCFFLPAYAFFQMQRYGIRTNDRELERMRPYVAAVLTAWCVGMATLSRCYAPSTYMIVGLAAAYINLAGYHRPRPVPILQLTPLTVQRWAVCSVGLLLASFAFVRVFARWSGA
jgi:hypothetical protein